MDVLPGDGLNRRRFADGARFGDWFAGDYWYGWCEKHGTIGVLDRRVFTNQLRDSIMRRHDQQRHGRGKVDG